MFMCIQLPKLHWQELLMRVGSSLSKNDRREEEEGAVSLLSLGTS